MALSGGLAESLPMRWSTTGKITYRTRIPVHQKTRSPVAATSPHERKGKEGMSRPSSQSRRLGSRQAAGASGESLCRAKTGSSEGWTLHMPTVQLIDGQKANVNALDSARWIRWGHDDTIPREVFGPSCASRCSTPPTGSSPPTAGAGCAWPVSRGLPASAARRSTTSSARRRPSARPWSSASWRASSSASSANSTPIAESWRPRPPRASATRSSRPWTTPSSRASCSPHAAARTTSSPISRPARSRSSAPRWPCSTRTRPRPGPTWTRSPGASPSRRSCGSP
ncbi:hypothetical protein STANM309S_03862 [Streptomyces tanashiensis]